MPIDFPACSVTCLVKFRNYTSNNLSITVLAAGIQVQGIRQEKFLFMDSLSEPFLSQRIEELKANKPFRIGVCLCLFRGDFVTDRFQVSYLLFGASSCKKVLKIKMPTEFQLFSRTRKRFSPEGHASESRQECENKRKVGENTLCLSNYFFFSKSFDYIF